MLCVEQNATWCQAPRIGRALFRRRSGGGGGGGGGCVRVESVQQAVGAPFIVDERRRAERCLGLNGRSGGVWRLHLQCWAFFAHAVSPSASTQCQYSNVRILLQRRTKIAGVRRFSSAFRAPLL